MNFSCPGFEPQDSVHVNGDWSHYRNVFNFLFQGIHTKEQNKEVIDLIVQLRQGSGIQSGWIIALV